MAASAAVDSMHLHPLARCIHPVCTLLRVASFSRILSHNFSTCSTPQIMSSCAMLLDKYKLLLRDVSGGPQEQAVLLCALVESAGAEPFTFTMHLDGLLRKSVLTPSCAAAWVFSPRGTHTCMYYLSYYNQLNMYHPFSIFAFSPHL